MDDAQRHAVDVDRLGGLERPDDEGDEVGRHHHGRREADPRAPVGRRRLADDLRAFETAKRPSATSSVISKTALRSGSSKQGKARRASVASNWVVAITCSVPLVVGEGRPVEAVQLVVEDALEAEPQRGLAGIERRREGERRALLLRVKVDRGGGERSGGATGVQLGVADLELGGVEHHRRGRLADGDVDLDLAREAGGDEVGDELEPVRAGG